MKANLAAARARAGSRRWEASGTLPQVAREREGHRRTSCTTARPTPTATSTRATCSTRSSRTSSSSTAAWPARPATIVPGWDCHGLPIELAVDKELGETQARHGQGRRSARSAARYANEFIDIQRDGVQAPRRLRRLGRSPTSRWPSATRRASCASSASSSGQGGLYRGKKPVYWCIHDRTALAEAEVEYEDHTSPSIYVAFGARRRRSRKLLPSARRPRGRPRHLDDHPVDAAREPRHRREPGVRNTWSTSCAAGPTVVASDLLVPFLAAVAPEELKRGHAARWPAPRSMPPRSANPSSILGYLEGAALEGLKYRHPLFDRISPVILGDHVTLEAGTGLVHTAPGHGQDDYLVGKKYGLPTARAGRRRGALHRGGRLVRGQAGLRGQPRDRRRAGRGGRAPEQAGRDPHATATRTAGAARSRSSSAPPTSGSSRWRPERTAQARARGHRAA